MRSSLFITLLALVACSLGAQDGAFTYRPQAVSSVAPHWGNSAYFPADYLTSTNPKALIIHFAGVGEKGTGATVAELQRMNVNSLPSLLAAGSDFDAVILCPQNDSTGWYRPDWVVDFVIWAKQTYRVDPDRVILTGLSIGGATCWIVGDTYPGLAAAYVPIAGSQGHNQWPIVNAGQTFRERPVWAWQNHDDTVVPEYLTRLWIDAISYGSSLPVASGANRPALGLCRTVWKNTSGGFTWGAPDIAAVPTASANATPRETVYGAGGHGQFSRPYQQAALWNWMLAQKSEPITLASTPASLTIAPNGTYAQALNFGCATMHPDYIKVSVTSSNLGVLPASALVLSGTGANRTLTINATAVSGTATVTITGSDWSRNASDPGIRTVTRTITVSVQSLTDRINELEGQLAAANQTIAARDASIVTLNATIAQQGVVINQQTIDLATANATIVARDATIAAQAQTITAHEQTIADLNADLAQIHVLSAP